MSNYHQTLPLPRGLTPRSLNPWNYVRVAPVPLQLPQCQAPGSPLQQSKWWNVGVNVRSVAGARFHHQPQRGLPPRSQRPCPNVRENGLSVAGAPFHTQSPIVVSRSPRPPVMGAPPFWGEGVNGMSNTDFRLYSQSPRVPRSQSPWIYVSDSSKFPIQSQRGLPSSPSSQCSPSGFSGQPQSPRVYRLPNLWDKMGPSSARSQVLIQPPIPQSIKEMDIEIGGVGPFKVPMIEVPEFSQLDPSAKSPVLIRTNRDHRDYYLEKQLALESEATLLIKYLKAGIDLLLSSQTLQNDINRVKELLSELDSKLDQLTIVNEGLSNDFKKTKETLEQLFINEMLVIFSQEVDEISSTYEEIKKTCKPSSLDLVNNKIQQVVNTFFKEEYLAAKELTKDQQNVFCNKYCKLEIIMQQIEKYYSIQFERLSWISLL